jgi:acetyl esterase/lipase
MLKKITLLSFSLFWTISTFGQRYLTETFSEVQVDTSIVYGTNMSLFSLPITGEPFEQDLEMDIYTPVGDTETNRPVVLYLHAGNSHS